MSDGAPLDAIEALYRTRYADFLRVATAITGSIEAGRDVVHDAFVASIRSRNTYRGTGTVEAWLWRVVVNSARKGRRDAPTDLWADHDQPVEPSAKGSEPTELSEVRSAVRALPERQRTVLFLRYYSVLDYATISEVLDIRSGTVGAALSAAHATLRQHLSEVSNA